MRSSMIIAVDYDDTLYVNGHMNHMLIRWLNARKKAGDILILWTCRYGRSLLEAVEKCQEAGLSFHLINENTPQKIQQYKSNPRKIYADMYIDDKAVNAAEWRKNV